MLLSLIEKLIQEHGSSSILRERLTQMREEVVHLTDQLAIAESANHDLQNNQENQRQRIEELERQVHALSERSYALRYGCLVFHDDDLLYCPRCFLRERMRSPTVRRSSRERVCTVCQAVIPSG